METFVAIISIVWGILSIILFFKVWSACDDIKRIADKYAPQKKSNINKSSFETAEDIDKWLNEK